MAPRASHNDPELVRITTAQYGRSVDRRDRERRYIWTMGIRTGCFLAAVTAYLVGAPHWLTWALILCSLFLPYIAVVMANAGSAADPTALENPDLSTGLPALESGDTREATR
ncbi:MAG: DUF3099 domain-containing protein [Nocardioidaceae bacterium]|nr:MAG: DUF3099 domain-containing protein [Nocardioidaceae bacterium]